MADRGTDQEDIGWRIRVLREALGHRNARAFAALVGWTAQQLNNYERARKRPEISQVIQLCLKTNVTLDWIYRGERSGLPLILADLIQRRLDAEIEAEKIQASSAAD